MQRARNGLGPWHHQFVETLLKRLLWHRPAVERRKGNNPELLDSLVTRFALKKEDVLEVFTILTVTRTHSGVSFHKTRAEIPVELAINWGSLAYFETGAEFEEYPSFADDPDIGSRWVQNTEEAILIMLAHELAHFVVALQGPVTHPHGQEFRDAYRHIRTRALNPMLDANAMSAKQRAASRHKARLLRKIKALRKMADDATSNAHEAERAMSQLESLLIKHGLDFDEPMEEAPHFVERCIPVIAKGRYKPVMHYCFAIAQFCGVEAVVHTRHWHLRATGSRGAASEYISYFGAAADVEMAVYLSELLHYSLEQEEARFRSSVSYRDALRQGTHAATLIASFRTAFTQKLQDRLLASRQAAENSWLREVPEHRAMTVTRDRARQEAFARRYPRLGTHRAGTSTAPRHHSARTAGRTAAEKIHLGKPERVKTTLRLPAGT